MKTAILAVVVAISACTFAGCASLTQSPQELDVATKRNFDKDRKLLTDDLQRFWMTDQPSRGTPLHM